MKSVCSGVAIAAVLWFVMFSPWTAPHIDFWLVMSASAVILTTYALFSGGSPFTGKNQAMVKSAVEGTAIAIVLWGVFWMGKQASQMIFPFASAQIDMIYNLKGDKADTTVMLLLLFVIGPAEELFWRGFVQRKLSLAYGRLQGFVAAWTCYTLVHIWSGNVMLLLAAAVCGFCWGMLYLLFPERLKAIVVSHALWDAAAFVAFPL